MTDKPSPRSSKKDEILSRIERLESILENRSNQPAAECESDATYALEQRLFELESKLSKLGGYSDSSNGDTPLHYCKMPAAPSRAIDSNVSANRARLILMLEKKWVNGTKLRYAFFGNGTWSGGNDQKDLVRQGFEVWKNVGIGIAFEEISDVASAEIRIGFLQGDGAWSYIGRDIVNIPGRSERTMNFGWDLTRDPRGVDVPVHEIGHTLGFPHEHQNPFAGIVWDEQAVIRYFGGPPNNWDEATTRSNILDKISPNDVSGSQWDPDSIMHYAFAKGLIIAPPQYKQGLNPHGGLSPRDISQVRLFYPPLDPSDTSELKPYRSQSLKLAPAQQANFTILPTVTRDYTIQTFGGSDTVMVLFEDRNGDLQYLKGDDDSGTDRNAKITMRLMAGRHYVLRIRMYSSFDTGEIAVMVW